MTVSQFIGYRLNNTAAVTAYTGTRIYHGNIPEDITTLPVINYFLIDHMSVNITTMYRDHFQISIRDNNPEDAWALANEVIDAFFELQDTVNGFDVQSCYYDNSRQLAEENTIYHIPIDIYVLYRRS